MSNYSFTDLVCMPFNGKTCAFDENSCGDGARCDKKLHVCRCDVDNGFCADTTYEGAREGRCGPKAETGGEVIGTYTIRFGNGTSFTGESEYYLNGMKESLLGGLTNSYHFEIKHAKDGGKTDPGSRITMIRYPQDDTIRIGVDSLPDRMAAVMTVGSGQH